MILFQSNETKFAAKLTTFSGNTTYTTLQNKTKLRQILLLIQNNLYHDLRVQFKDHMLHYQICYPSKRKKRSRRFYVTQRQKSCNQSIRSFTKELFSPLKMLLEQVTHFYYKVLPQYYPYKPSRGATISC